MVRLCRNLVDKPAYVKEKFRKTANISALFTSTHIPHVNVLCFICQWIPCGVSSL